MGFNNVDIVENITEDFLQYTGHVMQERAVPDARDCLKDGARKILYSQFLNKNTHTEKFVKGNSIVGRALVLGYLHGDQAAYQSLVRLGKPFALPYPYEEFQGNGGNQMDPGNHAAGRYLELRMSNAGSSLFEGIKDNAIEEWYWNYSDTEELPRVLPTPYFYPLVNGAAGISVGLSVSIPSYNLAEVNEAIIKIINNPDVDFDEIYCEPDFPMGGTVINKTEVKESIRNGKGKGCIIRAKLEYDATKHMIHATQMPFSVYTSTICENQLLDIINNNPNSGIAKYIDTTNENGGQINIYLEKDANPNDIIKMLYKETDLQYTYSINTIMLDRGRFPKVFGWREALDAYIAHLRECKVREVAYSIGKTEERLSILNALLTATNDIENIISLIKGANDNADARAKLSSKYNFSDEQCTAILSMRISVLTKLDSEKIEDEEHTLSTRYDRLQNLANDQKEMDAEIIEKLKEGIKLFGTKRKTTLIDLSDDDDTDNGPQQANVKVFSDDTFIFSNAPIKARASKKKSLVFGGACMTNDKLVCFTNTGKYYGIDLSKYTFDDEYNLRTIFALNKIEKIIAVFLQSEFEDTFIFATTNGLIKRTYCKEFANATQKGSTFISLQDNDSVVQCISVDNKNYNVLSISSDAHYCMYPISEISVIGRSGKGIANISLPDGITVVNVLLHELGKYLQLTTENDKIITVESDTLINTSRARRGPTIVKNKIINEACIIEKGTNNEE